MTPSGLRSSCSIRSHHTGHTDLPTSVTRRSIDEQGSGVVKVAPYYTITPESGEPRHRDVYHDHDNCSDGQRILPKHKVRGTGGLPKCDECKSLR